MNSSIKLFQSNFYILFMAAPTEPSGLFTLNKLDYSQLLKEFVPCF